MLNKNASSTKVLENPPQLVPKLDKPGAGLPWYHNFALRFFVGPFVAGRASWSTSEQAFHKINGRILKEIENLSEQQLSTKILVPPQLGLEDSSRYWSIAMVLEHIVIVGEGISAGIINLSNNQLPQQQVDIAAVKPVGSMPVSESVSEYKLFVSDDFKKFLAQVKDKDSKLTYKHPWFGNFNVKQWFWLLGVHSALHLKQIREIKKRLSVV